VNNCSIYIWVYSESPVSNLSGGGGHLFRHVCIITKVSVTLVRSAHLSPYVSTSPTGQILVDYDDFEDFMKLCQGTPYLIKIRKKYHAFYMKA
jgi:hypothetical protein